MPDGQKDDAGRDFADFIAAELLAEYERRASLDDRAVKLMGTSGGVLAATLALGAIALGGSQVSVTGGAVALILLSLAAMTAVNILAILANQLKSYEVADIPTLEAIVGTHWDDGGREARNQVSQQRIKTIASLRLDNSCKAKLLKWATWVQLGSLGLLVLALCIELLQR